MVKIRLTRFGKHKSPFYRIVSIDSRVKRDGGYIELLGTYEPNKKQLKLNKTEIIKWLDNGAKPSETVINLLKKDGFWQTYNNEKQIKKAAQLIKNPKDNKKKKRKNKKHKNTEPKQQ